MKKVYKLTREDQLTKKQIQEIREAKEKPLVVDDDCPAYSYEELAIMLEKTKGRTTPMQRRMQATIDSSTN